MLREAQKLPPLIVLVVTLLCLCRVAHADMGVPMLAVVWPVFWVLLVPVIVVEALICRRMALADLRRCFLVATAANLVSTFVGIPIAWAALCVLEQLARGVGFLRLSTTGEQLLAVTLQAAWLPPYEGDLSWMVPCAAVSLSVLFFFASVLVEYIVARRMLPVDAKPKAARWSWIANGFTYAATVALLEVLLWNISYSPVDAP